MKYVLLSLCLLFVATTAQSQFKIAEKGLTILVTDGTDAGRNSNVQPPSDIPTAYDQIAKGQKSGAAGKANRLVFEDPIRELGMTDCIQAAAFLERPMFGKKGFMLIFSINDSIGGRQAVLFKDGKTYQGVYRIIKQKTSSDEEVPEGMTSYLIAGTFLLLGIS